VLLPAQETGGNATAHIAPATPIAPGPTTADNWPRYLHLTFGPGAWLGSGFWSGVAQWRDYPSEWEQGASGYWKRYGHSHGRRMIRNTIDLGVATWRGEITTYSRCRCSGFGPRLGHAVKSTFIRRTNDGGTTLALGHFAGSYGSGFAANLWMPGSHNDFGDGLRRGTFSLSYEALRNVGREFWPDIRRKVFRRK